MESQVAPGGGTVDHEPRATCESAEAEQARDGCLTGADDSFGFSAAASWSLSGELPVSADLGGVIILRLLAEGGMGRVYEARQEAPRRIVAVKVIREGVVSAATSSRFLREAETLALLRHPHIAQIHTYGTAPAAYGGVPFFVMEMVENARPITRYAAVHGLSIRARIRLFLKVCEAVAHGHAHGVVHRDLKPANILVDDGGEPKLIDFGIALGIGPAAPDAEAGDPSSAVAVDGRTAAGGMGTLRYMSPEQVLAPTAGPDTRSDVYALGLVLHELVTGRLPYDLAGLSLAEARRVLGSTAAPATAAVERAVAAQESRDEARTLAVIAATCLEPRAAERYAHAGEVAADLACWLDGRAIAARPPTAIESLRRLARRHRIATAAVASLVATLAVATTAVALLSVRLESQRRTAEAARAVATAEAEAARRQLYASTVLLAAAARDNDNITDAVHLLERARGLVGTGTAPVPVELACLAASCDDSLAAVPQSSPLVTAVAWTPDGKVLASGGRGGEIMIRGASDAADTASRCLTTVEAGVWSIAFSPDGRVLAVAGDDGSVTLLDSRSGRQRAALEGFRRIAYSVAFSTDGDLVAAGSRDGSARLWEAATGRQIREFSGHTGTVYGVAFLPRGNRLVTGGQDGTVRIWNAETGEALHTLVGHTARVFDVAVAPDGATVASASEDGTVRLWDVDAGRETACLRHPIRVNALAYSDSAGSLATVASDGVVRVWDVNRGVEAARFRGHTAAAWSVAWAARDGLIATGGADGTVRLWSPVGRPDVVPLESRALAVAFAPDGDTVAVGVGGGDVWLYDATTLESRSRLEADAGRVNGVAWSPAGDLVAAACDGGDVFVWDASSHERILALKEHGRRVFCVGFSPDGGRLATASEDHTVRVLSPRTGKALGPSLKHPGRVFGVAFTHDGGRLVTACEDRLIRIWDAATGVEAKRLAGHDRQVNWVAISPGGERIASASSDGTVRLWRMNDGSLEHVLKGSARQVWKVAFSPDGTRVAAAAADGDVHLWDVATGGAVLALRGHADEVWAVAFAPDGRSLVSGSSDETLRLWGVGCREIVRRRDEVATGAATGAATDAMIGLRPR